MKRTTPLRTDPAKTRAWQDRSRVELKRSPLAKRGRKHHERFTRAFLSREYVHWIVKGHGCAVPECGRLDIDPAHTVKRSRGGRWHQIVPLCRAHHDEQEGRTEAFGRKYGIDLDEYALRLASAWMTFLGSPRHSPDP